MSSFDPETVSRIVIGGYTGDAGRAPGLRVLADRDSPAGEFAELQVVPLESPSYAVRHPYQPWLFVATETAPSVLVSFLVEADGRLTELSRIEAPGDYVCHLAVSPAGDLLLAACYGSGAVVSVGIDHAGRFSRIRDIVTFAGSGPDPERQEAPHAHQVLFHAGELLVCDLGTDSVHRLRVDSGGRFSADEPLRLPAGFGPRHAVVVRDHLVVVGELSAELWIGRREGESWTQAGLVATSGSAVGNHVQPSGIVSDGDLVLVANRGVNTVTVFGLVNRDDAAAVASSEGSAVTVAGATHSSTASGDGTTLVRLLEIGCGAWPRDLVLAAGALWIANERSDSVTAYDQAGLAALARAALSGAGDTPPSRPEPLLTLRTPSPAHVVITTKR